MFSCVWRLIVLARNALLRMRRLFLFLLLATITVARADPARDSAAQSCRAEVYGDAHYVVCRAAKGADIRLFLNNRKGEPFGHFNWINEALAAEGERLAFAMNAGMYHQDRSPVGLYVEAGEEIAPANMNDGPGNFHLKPNGVFWVEVYDGVRSAYVSKTEEFEEISHGVRFATQSGPMLVFDGDIHPRFLPNSDSLKRRNGVGVTKDGEVIFVLADTPVRFYDFAVFFRDELKTPNALYLDGTISRLYAPELDRNDPGVAMGPVVGMIIKD